jgi:hypothetical protein
MDKIIVGKRDYLRLPFCRIFGIQIRGLELPHFHVLVQHFCRIVGIYRHEADHTTAGRTIADIGHQLFVHIHIDVVSVRHNRQQIRLIDACMDRRAGAGDLFAIGQTSQVVVTAGIYTETVGRGRCGAEDQPAAIALSNVHLCLKSKIAVIRILTHTADKVTILRN